MMSEEMFVLQAISILIIAYMVIFERIQDNRDDNIRNLYKLALFSILFAVTEIVLNCVTSDGAGHDNEFIVCMIYLLIMATMCFYWANYCYARFHNVTYITGRTVHSICAGISLLIFVVLMVMACVFGDIFFDGPGTQSFNWVFVLYSVVAILPVIILLVDSISRSIRIKVDWDKRDFIAVIVFCIPFLLSFILQPFSDVPFISMGVTVGFVAMYFYNIQILSTIDTLTQVYNADVLEGRLISSLKSSKKTFVAVIQIGGNNIVNNVYGHEEGDRVLKDSAQCMKESVSGTSIFLGRVVNSKFLLVQEADDSKTLEEACLKVLAMIDEINSERPYVLMPMAADMVLTHFNSVTKTADEAEDTHIIYDRMNRGNGGDS